MKSERLATTLTYGSTAAGHLLGGSVPGARPENLGRRHLRVPNPKVAPHQLNAARHILNSAVLGHE